MNTMTNNGYITIDIPQRIAPELLEITLQKYSKQIRSMNAEYVVNLENVEQLYSVTLKVIMHIYKTVSLMNATLAIVNASPHIQHALTSLKIDTMIPLYETVTDFEFSRLEKGMLADFTQPSLSPVTL